MAPIALWDFGWLASNALINVVCTWDLYSLFLCTLGLYAIYEIASSLYVGLHTVQYNDEVKTIIGGLGLAVQGNGGGGGWRWKDKLIMYCF